MATEDQDQQPQQNSKLWLTIGVIVIITAIAVWLIPGNKTKSPDIPKPTSEIAPIQGIQPEPVAPNTTSPNETEGHRARQLIAEHKATGGELEDLYQKAQQLQKEGALADAYLLFFYSARNGHPDASLTLGKQADPAFYSAGSSVLDHADMVQAYKWYKLAENNGNSEASPLLQKLHEYVADQAETGSPVAQSLALQWK